MNNLEEAKTRAAAAYNAAADHFDHPANSFWDRFGRVTIDRLNLRQGNAVLDVCCGSGASAIPAAEKVGQEGYVLGVDLAENLLRLATAKANRANLTNIEFRNGDFLSLGLPDHSFDAVVCVFGIFFVPDMPAAVRELWRMVRPGGQLAITTWGPNVFEPVNSAFWNAVRQEAPELYKSFNPWDRISEPSSLRTMLREAGIEACDVTPQAGSHSIASPEDWWSTLLGSGYRGTIDQLNPRSRERVREANLQFVREFRITAVEANVLYAVAAKLA
jgi:ubiquinone/menaquinone biosynthesis C-methylase UbiE